MRCWAVVRSHEVVGAAVDTDVSGAMSPFDRPGPGPWLSDPERIASFDGIADLHDLAPVGRPVIVTVTPNTDDVKQAITAL
jgi:hypothetical protein